MKQFYSTTILFVFFNLYLQAQTPISITSGSMPGANDTLRYSNVRPNSVDVSLTGANYTWNYDTLKALSQGLYEYKSALATPYAFYFFGTNKYGLKVADTIGAGTFTFTEVYNFYKKTTADFQAEGVGFRYSGLPLAAYYSDPDEIYTFPLNYTDYDSTTFAFSVQLGTGISYSQKGYRINYVDGWGKIKTPYDSANCLRLVSTTIAKDSINYNGIGFSFPNHQRSYKWMVSTQKIPFLEVSGPYNNGIFAATQAHYRDTYKNMTGIADLNGATEQDFCFFPNPASSSLYIKTSTSNAVNIDIIDISGNLVFSKNYLHQDMITINTQAIANGMYFLRMTDVKRGTCLKQKLIIAK